jgi:hypothetical protein
VGDLVRASRAVPVSGYRNKQFNFFEQAFRQHTVQSRRSRAFTTGCMASIAVAGLPI